MLHSCDLGSNPKHIGILLKVLWIFKNIFETFPDLTEGDERHNMLKPFLKLCKIKNYAN